MSAAKYKEQFNEIYKKYITREGADKLLNWLLGSDFFTAPASTRFHNSFEGGLVLHGINTYNRLLKLAILEFGENYRERISDETIAVCGLLHDVCKADYYKIEMRNVKEDGVWVQRPYYTVDEALPFGHGEKSVYILNGFIRLTREEALAINWHMGGFDVRAKGGSASVSIAFERSPLCILLHMADLQATYIDEKR